MNNANDIPAVEKSMRLAIALDTSFIQTDESPVGSNIAFMMAQRQKIADSYINGNHDEKERDNLICIFVQLNLEVNRLMGTTLMEWKSSF